jgi:hypothetical protein
MSNVMTRAEIENAFPCEWVLIVDPQTDQALNVQSGQVFWHSKDRDEVYNKMLEAPGKRVAVLYTGPIPAPGTAIIL